MWRLFFTGTNPTENGNQVSEPLTPVLPAWRHWLKRKAASASPAGNQVAPASGGNDDLTPVLPLVSADAVCDDAEFAPSAPPLMTVETFKSDAPGPVNEAVLRPLHPPTGNRPASRAAWPPAAAAQRGHGCAAGSVFEAANAEGATSSAPHLPLSRGFASHVAAPAPGTRAGPICEAASDGGDAAATPEATVVSPFEAAAAAAVAAVPEAPKAASSDAAPAIAPNSVGSAEVDGGKGGGPLPGSQAAPWQRPDAFLAVEVQVIEEATSHPCVGDILLSTSLVLLGSLTGTQVSATYAVSRVFHAFLFLRKPLLTIACTLCLQERLGTFFTDYRGTHMYLASFRVFHIAQRAVLALIVGLLVSWGARCATGCVNA